MGRKDGSFIPPHGGYRNLLSYRKAEIIYDATVRFCERFIDRYDRTRDQMIQAARCGKQNLIEGSIASGTSKKIELNLTGIARASLGELLGDYEDFLRVRKLLLWDKNSRQARTIRNLGSGKQMPHASYESYETYRSYIETGSPETAANTIICLIHQANYLIDRQIRRLEKDFLSDGGLSERMTKARIEARAQAAKSKSRI
jgi:four helix bundle suffix protein